MQRESIKTRKTGVKSPIKRKVHMQSHIYLWHAAIWGALNYFRMLKVV